MQSMHIHFRQTLWKNFAAGIDMLKEIIRLCPEEIWARGDRFFYMTYHTAIFLDYYLSAPVRAFNPPLSYTLADPDQLPENAVDDVIPNETYHREQMQQWLTSLRARARVRTLDSTDAELMDRWIQDDEMPLHLGCPSLVKDYSLLEILFYNLRHVQHHVAQLNQMLSKEGCQPAEWISYPD